MKKLCAALAVACAGLVGVTTYQFIPASKPGEPVYVQRVRQTFDALGKGDYKAVCDASPTAGIDPQTYLMFAYGSGVRTPADFEKFCERAAAAAVEDGKGGLLLVEYEILYYTESPTHKEGDVEVVIVRLRIGDQPVGTFALQVVLARLPWGEKTAKCGPDKVACPALRWYALNPR